MEGVPRSRSNAATRQRGNAVPPFSPWRDPYRDLPRVAVSLADFVPVLRNVTSVLAD